MNNQHVSKGPLQRYILGTAGLGGVWRKVDPQESVRTILEALEMGIPGIDTAPAYGDAEIFVGEALRRWKGIMPNISTKVGRLKGFASDVGHYDYTAAAMEKSVEKSLKTLGVEAIDTLLLHEPAAIAPDLVNEAVHAMTGFKKKGYAKNIGLGGNYPGLFRKYVTGNAFDVVMEYNRLNACNMDALNTSLQQCQQYGVDFWAASPLFMGLLGSEYERFIHQRPDWIPPAYIEIARQVKLLADEQNISLPAMAFQFMKKIPASFKIVIGASNSAELHSTRAFIEAPCMDNDIYDQILGFINKTSRNHK